VIADDGTEAEYDRLLLATGSNPFILPVPGKDLPGVIAYRDIADTDAMIDAAKPTSTPWSSAAACSAWKRPTACAARHGRDRGASRRLDHGTPARRDGRTHAAEIARRRA
jgi:NADPH-dependent 2,4-dienoyl-CoA reductase/sulfur reductase-like enzyme